MAPWKCPDCGVWWAGLEHRCAPIGTSTGSSGTEGMNPRGNDLGKSPGPILTDATGCNCQHIAPFPTTTTTGTVTYRACPAHPVRIYSSSLEAAILSEREPVDPCLP